MIQGEFGKYRIDKMIGMGGMSMVYRAFDRTSDREIALKLLNMQFATSPLEVRRFKREMQVAQRLRHPNIIDIYEYGEVDGFPYLAMEYMPGGSLSEKYADPIYVTLEETTDTLDVIASALDFAHAEGVLHRDLKLSNILVGEDGRLVLSDFGLALVQDESRLTRSGQALGTPIYMAPEQVSGVRDIDYRADIYALGVIAYLLTVGYFPFNTQNTLMVLNQHLLETPPPPSKLNPRLPMAIDDVLLKALAKRPDARFGSAGALARALREVTTSLATTEVIILSGHPTPIISSPGENARSTASASAEETQPDDLHWAGEGEFTPNLRREIDAQASATPAASAEMPAPLAEPRSRRGQRRVLGLLAGVAALVILWGLNGLLPPGMLASLGMDATDDPATATLTLPFTPTASAVSELATEAETEPLMISFDATEELLPSATASPTRQTPTATRTASRTPRPSATRTASPTATRTASRTPTMTRTPMPTQPPTTRAELVIVEPTQGGGEVSQPQPTSVPPINLPPPAPTSVPPTNVPPPVPTSVPPTNVPPPPPTSVPPTSVPPTEAPAPTSAPLIEIPLVDTLLPGLGGLLGG